MKRSAKYIDGYTLINWIGEKRDQYITLNYYGLKGKEEREKLIFLCDDIQREIKRRIDANVAEKRRGERYES